MTRLFCLQLCTNPERAMRSVIRPPLQEQRWKHPHTSHHTAQVVHLTIFTTTRDDLLVGTQQPHSLP